MPRRYAWRRRGARNHAYASTATATPSSSSSAYMRASRPWTISNALHAMIAVASTPTRPRSRIHHANSPSAPIEQSTPGTRNQKALTPRRASGRCRR